MSFDYSKLATLKPKTAPTRPAAGPDPDAGPDPAPGPDPAAGPGPTGTGKPVPFGPDPAAGPRPLAERVPVKDGFSAIPNTVLDNVLPQLKPYDQLVYLRLLRLSWGFQRTDCEVSVPAIVTATGVPRTQVFEAIGRLEAQGLVKRVEAKLGGARHSRGNRYEVAVPGLTSPATGRDPVAGRGPGTGRGPAAGPDPAAGHIKDLKTKDIKESSPSIYEVRTVAARLFEAHRNDPGFDHQELLRLVREALIGQGRVVDEATLEQAAQNMLPGA